MAQQPNPIDVQKALGGVDYPVGRNELVSKAEDNGADESVLAALKSLPDKEFDGPSAVSQALGKDGD